MSTVISVKNGRTFVWQLSSQRRGKKLPRHKIEVTDMDPAARQIAIESQIKRTRQELGIGGL